MLNHSGRSIASTRYTSARTATTPTNQNLPDLVPNSAQLFDGGRGLRVTIANISTNVYDGPIEVSVTGLTTGTLTQVYARRVPAGGSVVVDFELDPAVTTQKTAAIRVDPNNAIPASRKRPFKRRAIQEMKPGRL